MDSEPIVFLDSRLNSLVYHEILATYGIDLVENRFVSYNCYWVHDDCPENKARIIPAFLDWFNTTSSPHNVNYQLLNLSR